MAERLVPGRGLYTIKLIEAEGEKVTPGGIILPDSQKEKERPQWAEIIDVGPGVVASFTGKEIAPDYKAGDRICINKYSGIEVEYSDGRKVYIIGGPDIHGVLVDDESE